MCEQKQAVPVLHNNKEREEFARNYREWGLWYQDDNIETKYYKFDFPDGSRIIVAEYKNNYIPGHCSAHYKTLKPGEHFNCYDIGMTAVINFLKEKCPNR